jgi:signal transduction histidine kinase
LAPIDVDPAGLIRALQDLADRTQQMYEVNCTFECPAPVEITDSFRATHFYRIAREAVHNAVKHAMGKQISIGLYDDSGITLTVRDNGVGIKADHFTEGEGLRIMRYRAGLVGATLSITNAPNGGTTVTCKMEH